MNRVGWFLIVAGVAVTVVAVHDLYADPESPTPTAVSESSQASTSETPEIIGDDNVELAEASLTQSFANMSIEPDTIAKWVAETNSEDQRKRDIANEALIKSPREKVLPVLQRLVANGSTSERELTLNALHEIALKEGDEDGEIKNILRLISYDGDDALASTAQLTLENIENNGDMAVVR